MVTYLIVYISYLAGLFAGYVYNETRDEEFKSFLVVMTIMAGIVAVAFIGRYAFIGIEATKANH